MRASGGLPTLFLTHFRNRSWKRVCAPRYIYLSLSGLLSFKSSRLFLLALIVSLLLRPRLRFCPILLSSFSFLRHLRSPSHKRNDSFPFLKLSLPSFITFLEQLMMQFSAVNQENTCNIAINDLGNSPGDTALWRLIYTFYCFVVACCSSRISFKSSCFKATPS